MNNPRRKPRVSELCHENYLQSVTPECFYRGSTMLTTTLSQVEGSGVQSRVRLDFTSTSSVWQAQPPLKACGNDGLRRAAIHSTQRATGIDPKKFKDAI